jgi:outer membrane protein assembly factor BamA
VTWTARPSGARRERGTVTLGTAYRLSYFDYVELDVDLGAIEGSRMGLDLRAPYILSYAEEQVVWDARNDPLSPTRGLYAQTALGMAGGPFGAHGAPLLGQYDFVKVQGDLRSFSSLAPRLRLERGLVLAARLAGGLAQPFGDDERASVPYAEHFMVGGSNSVRGWVTDHLGPRICARRSLRPGLDSLGLGGRYDPVDADHSCADPIPIGGRVYALGSLELRRALRWGFGLVGFVDAGMAWEDLAAIAAQPPLPTAGVGLRYKSPIGPIRLDLGFRLDHDADFSDEGPLNVHFSLSEAF